MRALLAWFCLAIVPVGVAEPMEGADYAVLERRVAPPGGRIEVIEFFYYGCGACARLEPAFETWRRGVDADVQVLRIPVADAAPRWTALARLYYALEQLSLVDVLHGEVFRAIHQGDRNLSQRDEQIRWAKDQGIDEALFLQALESAQVAERVQAARELAASYHVRSTPSLVVDGQYVTSGAMTGDLNTLIPITEALIQMARHARRSSK